MLGSAIANSINATIEAVPIAQTETFRNQRDMSPSPARLAFVSVLTVFLVFIALLFAGKYLWNNVLHELVPAIKPAKSVWQILGLAVLIMLLHPGSCNC
jgi:sterol desaturase/sphingolipid hydroxylase (fatty acid hydroxylase superfamily)